MNTHFQVIRGYAQLHFYRQLFNKHHNMWEDHRRKTTCNPAVPDLHFNFCALESWKHILLSYSPYNGNVNF